MTGLTEAGSGLEEPSRCLRAPLSRKRESQLKNAGVQPAFAEAFKRKRLAHSGKGVESLFIERQCDGALTFPKLLRRITQINVNAVQICTFRLPWGLFAGGILSQGGRS